MFLCTMNFPEDSNFLVYLLWQKLSKNRAKTCGELLSLYILGCYWCITAFITDKYISVFSSATSLRVYWAHLCSCAGRHL